MEDRILAVINGKELLRETLVRACEFAARTSAAVLVLVVLQEDSDCLLESEIRSRIEPLIDEQRLNGINVEYFIVWGDVRREVIRFIVEHNVNSVVWPFVENEEILSAAVQVQRVTGCRVEFVRSRMKQ
ncbi:universal stress protein [Thermodesulforhabdus norvegica]|uniref:Universal stress protein n=1 Tax=Thermodesulforhabdus norvegica TaxID=39841 RepID=A0A1I4SWV6_9BACT|nr:universal stress protein [Thermodesulforhabdus norvegica]SFM69008.1 hypothetical protein SAMN05660836_01213 [Thermodesulforhabdus norvegica]